MRKRELLQTALSTYGAAKQTLKVTEEVGEMMKELSKNAWGVDNRAQIAEEIADVRIMLDQMAIFHECEHLSRHYEQEKLERLADRLGVEYGE